MSELMNKEISKEADLGLVFEEKKVKLKLAYAGKGAGAEVSVYVDSEYFIDLLAKAIPGELDDMILAGLKAAL